MTSGRHRSADGEAGWLRINPRQQRRSAIWSSHSIRLRRSTCRSLSGPCLALPPLNTTLAQRMMEPTKIYTALKGVRGRKPVDIAALEQLLVRFSQLVLEQPWIAEIDINPLLASPDRLLALDARIVLHGRKVTLDQLPQAGDPSLSHAVRCPWTLRDGNEIVIRPIRPEDEPLMVKFHETLSDRSVYLRYFCSLSLSRRVAHERLLRSVSEIMTARWPWSRSSPTLALESTELWASAG